MVGGSTMFGAGATSDETTIPGYLQHLLSEKDFEFDIEVINSGIQGADSNTELNLIEQKLVTLSPDLIIIYDGWNDLRANHTPKVVKENWEKICEFGKANDFDVIITLQPIAGFGNKVLTNQELKYAQTGEDYTNNLLIESSSIYQNYAKNLSEIKTCTETIDLRDVFDSETGVIYSDQGHVSDQGNAIVAKSLYNAILPIVLKNKVFNISENVEDSNDLTVSMYDGREIVVNLELLPSNESDNKKIKIRTYDNTNYEYIQNVTYFLSISKNNENLLAKYFFAEDGILIIDIQPNNDPLIKVIGEKQYAHDAYVMPGSEYKPEMEGEILTSVTPIRITGQIFNTEGIYTIAIQLRTIDSRDNWAVVFIPDYQITVGKDGILEDPKVENQLP